MTTGIERIGSYLDTIGFPHVAKKVDTTQAGESNSVEIVLVKDNNGKGFQIAVSVLAEYYVFAIADYLPANVVDLVPGLAQKVFYLRHKDTPGVKYTLDEKHSHYIIQAEMELTGIVEKDTLMLLNRLFGVVDLRSYREEDMMRSEIDPATVSCVGGTDATSGDEMLEANND